MKTLKFYLFGWLLFSQFLPTMTKAKELPQTIEIEQITCKAFLKMEGEEREFSLLYFHGFMSGKNVNRYNYN
jgi:hypothetical protein